MNYIFLDTNIFIHFVDFEEIDWHFVIGNNEEFTIAVAQIIISELDKHKYNSNRKLSGKAQRALSKLEKFIDKPSQCKYKFLFIDKTPDDGFFHVNSLSKSDQDDTLLASIKEFELNLPATDQIIYVTNDTGPRIKSKPLKIIAIKPLQKYLLETEPDATEKKLKALEKELSQLKQRASVINLLFKNGEQLLTVSLKRPALSRSEFIEKAILKVQSEHPHFDI